MGILTWIVLCLPLGIWLFYTSVVSLYVKDEPHTYYGNHHKFTDGLDNAALATITATLVWAMVLLATSTSIKNCKNIEITRTEEYEIVSASQTDRINGRIYLLGGYIHSSPVYKAYKKNEDGSLSMVWLYAENVRIVETNEVPPHIVKYVEGYKIPKWTKWDRLLFGKEGSKTYKNLLYAKLSHCGVIYIPEGTIKPTFDRMNL